jgi:hypothetical protein
LLIAFKAASASSSAGFAASRSFSTPALMTPAFSDSMPAPSATMARLDLDEQGLRHPLRLLEVLLLDLELLHHLADVLAGLEELVEPDLQAPAQLVVHGVLVLVGLLVLLDERQVGLRRHVDLAAEALEVLVAGQGHALVHERAVLDDAGLDLRARVDLEAREVLLRHRGEGVLGPRQEPRRGAALAIQPHPMLVYT